MKKPVPTAARGEPTAVLILAAAAVLLAICARGGLWFDEVWTARFANHVPDMTGIFREAHDNNHLLNTLWFYLVGPFRSPLLYRLPAIFSGVASVLMAGCLAARFGKPARNLAMAITAFSFPLVNYFSEARGYGPALACALGALLALLAATERPSLRAVAGFWVLCAVGLLSHLTMTSAIAALFPPACVLALSKRHPRFRLRHLAALFSVPLVCTALLYVLFASKMGRGGGAEDTWLGAWEGLAALTAGLRGNDTGRGVLHAGALFMTLGVVLTVRHFLRRGEKFWAVLAISAAFAPPLLALASPIEGFKPRYYLATLPFLLTSFAVPLAGMLKSRARIRRYGAALVLAALLGANGTSVAALAFYGRSGYGEAARDMLRIGCGVVSVVADQESRQYVMLDYELKSLGRETSLRFRHGLDAMLADSAESHNTLNLFDLPPDEPRQPEFLLTQSFWKTAELETMETAYGSYRLVRSYEYYGGPSGWNVYLYRAARD